MQQKKYRQWTAMMAIARGSFRSILRSPSVIVFSIAFPLIFILVFGFIGGGSSGMRFTLVAGNQTDTSTALFKSIANLPNLKFVHYADTVSFRNDLIKGKVDGVLSIIDADSFPQIAVRSTTASAQKIPVLTQLLEGLVNRMSNEKFPDRQAVAKVQSPVMEEVRPYRNIDFILPGQLGFSLLSAGVFGVAFLFFNLRQLLVLKRFYATPVSRLHIVLGEGLSRVTFQMLAAIIIVGLGYFAFNFTLVHGWLTFAEIMVLCFFALLVFMGFGFIISSLAKNSSSIPPLANIITLPQFLLAGTFFSIDVFPAWMQPFCRILPLTFFNDAMRSISFEGMHLTDNLPQLAGLLIWGLIAYAVAARIFKWE